MFRFSYKRTFGDARYPYSVDGLNLWAHTSGNVVVEESIFNIILNFFEGMACEGGCLNGPLCINHGPRNMADVDKYGNEATEKTIDNSVKLWRNVIGEE